MAGNFLFVIGLVGNAFALLLFLSPIFTTFTRIIQNRATQEFSGYPYVMTLLNCLFSAWCGLLFVTADNLLISSINCVGAVIESIYVIIFIIYTPRWIERFKILGVLALMLTSFAIIARVSTSVYHGNDRKLFCGYASAFFSIIMYASPLSVTWRVITTESVEYMPFFVSLFMFLRGLSWSMYGLLVNDLSLTVPNGIGCGLGAMQLILYAVYWLRAKRNADEKNQPFLSPEERV